MTETGNDFAQAKLRADLRAQEGTSSLDGFPQALIVFIGLVFDSLQGSLMMALCSTRHDTQQSTQVDEQSVHTSREVFVRGSGGPSLSHDM